VDQQPAAVAITPSPIVAGSANLPASPAGTLGPGAVFDSAVIYVVAFVTGAIVMSFEMLGSRYLNPYFGSGIYTWAALISTVLAALTAGYFVGGWLADRTVSPMLLGCTILAASLYLLALPSFAEAVLEFVLADIDDVRTGSLLAAFAVMFFPVTLYGVYSPFAIRLMLRSALRSGTVSGTVYGISTAGSIVGTLGTTFVLIPLIGSRAITLALGTAGVVCALMLMGLSRLHRGGTGAVTSVVWAAALLVLGSSAWPTARADELVDETIRAGMLQRPDGRIAHIESVYNDIYVNKRRSELTLSFQLKGWDYTESITNLADADDLVLRYAQTMTVSVLHPETPKRILMLGLGGGSLSTYLGRFMPDAAIDIVELDKRVIEAAKNYFGLRATDRVRYLDADGRVYLNRNKQLYDLILLDAYRGGFVPFHLLTREFYTLVKERLAPGGAVASNVHDGSKLYHSTVKTLSAVFPGLDLYPSGQGEVIALGSAAPLSPETLAARAMDLQERYKFRFPLPQLLERRMQKPLAQVAGGDLLTDDFAPVNLYDSIGRTQPRRR
jgi:predicted membrane-bound spermidine synthase